eukprot:355777-Chlamydomonas_euryale.AAC.1
MSLRGPMQPLCPTCAPSHTTALAAGGSRIRFAVTFDLDFDALSTDPALLDDFKANTTYWLAIHVADSSALMTDRATDLPAFNRQVGQPGVGACGGAATRRPLCDALAFCPTHCSTHCTLHIGTRQPMRVVGGIACPAQRCIGPQQPTLVCQESVL